MSWYEKRLNKYIENAVVRVPMEKIEWAVRWPAYFERRDSIPRNQSYAIMMAIGIPNANGYPINLPQTIKEAMGIRER